MHQRTLLLAAVIAVAGLVLACAPATDEPAQLTDEEIEAMAREIHERVITIDTHDDIPANFATAEVDPGVRDGRQVTLPKMREGGLDAAFFVVYVGQGERTEEAYARAKEAALVKFAAIHRMAEEMYPDEIEIAYTAADVERIVASGKLVSAIGIENGYPIGTDLANLQEFYDLGGRYITLSHSGHNQICDSSSASGRLQQEETEHGGVSEFGEQVIAEMNRLGMMIDVSHVSKESMLDAARLSQAPIIASHSSSRALCDVSRNLDDEQLLAMKENGGVAQMCALSSFVKQDPARTEAVTALREELGLTRRMGRAALAEMSDEERADYEARLATYQERVATEIDVEYPPANVQDFVDHIDHAVELVGIDHVGIASDFDGGGGIEGWNDASESPNVTRELVKRGYTEEEIAKLWGGNLLRVWREVESVAAGQ
jgi:microsomal dipeptidase-like Zn-dependent dipeptidase